jgi:hypothetical protein
MTENEKIIAVAEFCGWTDCRVDCILDEPIGIPPNAEKFGQGLGSTKYHPIPHSLDSIHEVEKKLDHAQLVRYDQYLRVMALDGNRDYELEAYPSDFVWHANVRERRDALLMTIGRAETL